MLNTQNSNHLEINPILFGLLLFALFIAIAGICYLVIFQNSGVNSNKTTVVVKEILQNVEVIINYYEPIFNGSGKIVDFKIIYANDSNRVYLNLDSNELIGKKISEVFPFLFLNGEFEGLVECFINKKRLILHRQINLKGERIWMQSIVNPMANGVSVMATNTTSEKAIVNNLKSIIKELKLRNQSLLETEVVVNHLLENTSEIIGYFEPIYGKENSIIDFEIVFISKTASEILEEIPNKNNSGTLSDSLPKFMTNGIFDFLSKSVKNVQEPKLIELTTSSNGTATYIAAATKTNLGVILVMKKEGALLGIKTQK